MRNTSFKIFFALGLFILMLPQFSFAEFTSDLHYGSTGADVSALQEFLTQQKVYSGPTSGSFYSLTLAGVKKFQSAEGITPVSGYVGRVTRGVINQILAGQVSTSEENATTTRPPVDLSQQKDQSSSISSVSPTITLPNGAIVRLNTDGAVTSYTPPTTLRSSVAEQNQKSSRDITTQTPTLTPLPTPSIAIPTSSPIIDSSTTSTVAVARALTIANSPHTVSKTVVVGSQRVSFATIQLVASDSPYDIYVGALPLILNVGNSAKATDISDCMIWLSGNLINAGANIVSFPKVGTKTIFSFDPTVMVPKYGALSLPLTCNIATSSTPGGTYSWSVDTNTTDYIGLSSATIINVADGPSPTITISN